MVTRTNDSVSVAGQLWNRRKPIRTVPLTTWLFGDLSNRVPTKLFDVGTNARRALVMMFGRSSG